jgi:hypothetical protein
MSTEFTLMTRTNRMITKLIMFCSQTGLVTTLVHHDLHRRRAFTYSLRSVAAFGALGIVNVFIYLT